MDSMAFLSSDIVLCDEIRYEEKIAKGGYGVYEATFKVVETFKGTCRPKEEITVEIDQVYVRKIIGLPADGPGKLPEIPLGRVLLFLTKEGETRWPVSGGVKLIVENETYCYGQFLTNPGPLWLARMAPENFDLPAETPYNEELLIKDLKAALEKSKHLTKAKEGFATDAVIRKRPTPK